MMSNRGSSSDAGPIGNPSVSIGNYKGVMLCNRPFAGASGAANKQKTAASHGGSFKCGTVETEWGKKLKDCCVSWQREWGGGGVVD